MELNKYGAIMMKRLFDIIFSLIALLIFAVPICLDKKELKKNND